MNNLKEFLDKERAVYVRETGMPLPSIDPLAIKVSDCPLIQQYVSTRLHYYGGGENKRNAACAWADEALTNPQRLD